MEEFAKAIARIWHSTYNFTCEFEDDEASAMLEDMYDDLMTVYNNFGLLDILENPTKIEKEIKK